MASIHHTDLVDSSYQTSASPITDTNTINKYRQSNVTDKAPLLSHNIHDESSSHGHGGGPVTPSASVAATFQNLVKPFIGAGILALPKAFYEGGLVASILLMTLLAVVANYCIRKLLMCADALPNFLPRSQPATPIHRPQRPFSAANHHHHNDHDELCSSSSSSSPPVIVVPTYREIGEAAFGRLGVFLVDFNLCASQIGFCIAYVSFISSNMSDVVPQLSKNEWVLLLFGGFSILTQIRRIETIAHTSLIGNLVYALSLSIIFYQGFKSHCCISHSSIEYVNWSGLPFLFGTACFALEGAGLILPVKAGMKEPSKFSSLLNSAITLVCACYIVFASLGYLFFGNQINSEITKNLDPGALADTVKGSLSVSLFFSYGIQMFPVTEMLDKILDDRYFSTSSSADEVITPIRPSELTGRPRIIRVIVHSISRVFIVAFTAVIAVIFPNFGLIVSLVGALSNSAIAFILPMLFYLKLIVLPEFRRKQSEVGSLALSIRDEWSGDRHVANASFSPSKYENTNWNTIRPWMLPLTVIVVGIMASILGLYVTIKSAVS